MRNTILALCALSVIGGSLLIARSGPPGPVWTLNQTHATYDYLKIKVRVGKAGTFSTTYVVRPMMTHSWDSFGCLFMGDLACPPGLNQSFHWSLWFPAGNGTKYCPVRGGKYRFSTKKDGSSMYDPIFRQDMAAGIGWLDYGYRGNSTIRALFKAAVTPVGGNVEVTTIKAAGSTKPGDAEADGKFKFSFTGSVLDGPHAGEPIKGTIQVVLQDARREDP